MEYTRITECWNFTSAGLVCLYQRCYWFLRSFPPNVCFSFLSYNVIKAQEYKSSLTDKVSRPKLSTSAVNISTNWDCLWWQTRNTWAPSRGTFRWFSLWVVAWGSLLEFFFLFFWLLKQVITTGANPSVVNLLFISRNCNSKLKW